MSAYDRRGAARQSCGVVFNDATSPSSFPDDRHSRDFEVPSLTTRTTVGWIMANAAMQFEGKIDRAAIPELGSVINDPKLGRTDDQQITIADLTRAAVQDVQIAEMVKRVRDERA